MTIPNTISSVLGEAVQEQHAGPSPYHILLRDLRAYEQPTSVIGLICAATQRLANASHVAEAIQTHWTDLRASFLNPAPRWTAPTFEVVVDSPPIGRSMSTRKNWCPNCLEYLPANHDTTQGVSCEEYQKDRGPGPLTLNEVRKQEADKTSPVLRELRLNPVKWCATCQEYLPTIHDSCKEHQRKPYRLPIVPEALDNEITYAERCTYLTGRSYTIDPSLLKPEGNNLPANWLTFARHGGNTSIVNESVKKVSKRPLCITACVSPRAFTFNDGSTITLCECGRTKGHQVFRAWKVSPPLPFSEMYVRWRAQCLPMGDVEAWYAEWCTKELVRLGLGKYAGMGRGLNYFGNTFDIENISTAIERELVIGGRRVNTNSRLTPVSDAEAGRWDENRSANKDTCSRDYRARGISNREHLRVPKTESICLYPRCGKSFTARKGTKYCSEGNCRQRHWEDLNSKEATA